MIQLPSNKITPHFQLLFMSKVDLSPVVPPLQQPKSSISTKVQKLQVPDYLQMYSANSPVIIGTPKGLIGWLSTPPSSSAA